MFYFVVCSEAFKHGQKIRTQKLQLTYQLARELNTLLVDNITYAPVFVMLSPFFATVLTFVHCDKPELLTLAQDALH